MTAESSPRPAPGSPDIPDDVMDRVLTVPRDGLLSFVQDFFGALDALQGPVGDGAAESAGLDPGADQG